MGDAFDEEWLDSGPEGDTAIALQQSTQMSGEYIHKALTEHV